ncbi:MAG: DUF5058 family protein [Clostridiales bacterium]|nr:DUF5058 family protein [Clostridiales bacterium]
MAESYTIIYVIGALVAAAIIVMSVFFIVKAFRRAKLIGMDTKVLKKTIKNSAIFSIVPSIPIVIGIGIMMQYLGIAIPWIRLTVIGALQYELIAMDTAGKALESVAPNYTSQMLIANAVTVMTLSILGGLIFNLIAYKKYQTKLADLQKKNAKLMDAITGALLSGMLSGMLSAILVGGIFTVGKPASYTGGINNYGEIVLITLAASVVIMALCGLVMIVFKQKWVENYALPITILGALAVAYAFVPLFDSRYIVESQKAIKLLWAVVPFVGV